MNINKQLDYIEKHLEYLIELTEGMWIKNPYGDMYIPDMIENVSKELKNVQLDIKHIDFLKMCNEEESEYYF